jgi:hypothetical protein
MLPRRSRVRLELVEDRQHGQLPRVPDAGPSGMNGGASIRRITVNRSAAVASHDAGTRRGGNLSSTATADGGTTPKIHDGWMWDLTVPGDNDHDFYVAITTTIAGLVHNCPASDSGREQTVHAAERAADPSRLDPAAQADVIANPTQTLSQADGAQVYVQQVGDRYNVVVQGDRGVITI